MILTLIETLCMHEGWLLLVTDGRRRREVSYERTTPCIVRVDVSDYVVRLICFVCLHSDAFVMSYSSGVSLFRSVVYPPIRNSNPIGLQQMLPSFLSLLAFTRS